MATEPGLRKCCQRTLEWVRLHPGQPARAIVCWPWRKWSCWERLLALGLLRQQGLWYREGPGHYAL